MKGAAARLNLSQVDNVVEWLTKEQIGVLNVAGPRESLRPGIHETTKRFMSLVLSHACK